MCILNHKIRYSLSPTSLSMTLSLSLNNQIVDASDQAPYLCKKHIKHRRDQTPSPWSITAVGGGGEFWFQCPFFPVPFDCV